MADDPAERLLAVWRAARAKRRRIVRLVTFGGLLSTLIAIVLPGRWTAAASFFPESHSTSDLTSSLSSLAGLMGAVGGAGGLTLGPPQSQFFADLVKSRTFLDSLALTSVPIDSLGGTARVEDYLVWHARNGKIRLWKARKALQKAIRVTTEQSGVVVIAVTTKSPYASAALANRAIEVIDELNIAFRHREAAARRRSTQQFLDDVQGRLTDAENVLEDFLTTNRTFVTPALTRRQEALEFEVSRLRSLKQQLEASIENARLSEYNEAPVVTTVDEAAVPERESGPLRLVIAVGGLLATIVAIFWALYLNLWR